MFKHLLTSMLAAGAVSASAQPSTPTIFAEIMGDWDVRSRMWKGSETQPEEQPVATAQRRVPPGGGFLEERLSGTAGGKPYTRLATLGYNAPEQLYEYASMDTRAPQLMQYRSQGAAPAYAGTLRFAGGDFAVVEYGRWRAARFAYRIELDPVNAGRQTMRIYFRPTGRQRAPEFLAMQYDYTCR